jgi:hypothetical protein
LELAVKLEQFIEEIIVKRHLKRKKKNLIKNRKELR